MVLIVLTNLYLLLGTIQTALFAKYDSEDFLSVLSGKPWIIRLFRIACFIVLMPIASTVYLFKGDDRDEN